MEETNIYNTIKNVSALLDELDDFEKNISTKEQEFDYKLSDLYHKLEDMTLDSKKCYRFCKEMKEVLLERRKYKNEVLIYQEYQKYRQKLNSGIDNRKILLSSLGLREKRLNQPYNNRIYTEEELVEKIGV